MSARAYSAIEREMRETERQLIGPSHGEIWLGRDKSHKHVDWWNAVTSRGPLNLFSATFCHQPSFDTSSQFERSITQYYPPIWTTHLLTYIRALRSWKRQKRVRIFPNWNNSILALGPKCVLVRYMISCLPVLTAKSVYDAENLVSTCLPGNGR